MAIELPNSIFFHLPKTGGSWVKKVIENSQIEYRLIKAPQDGLEPVFLPGHTPPWAVEKGDKKTFSFVRHPLSWLQSYWAYRRPMGWGKKNIPLDALCGDNSFPKFVDNYLEKLPGYYSSLVETYCGSVDFVGRYENLIQDLTTILALWEPGYDLCVLIGTPAINVSNLEGRNYAPKQKEQIIKVEEKTIRKYYADETNEN